MARTRASACAAASLAAFLAVVAEGGAVTDEKNVVVDDDLGRGRDLVPLPPVPETMALPTPTEAAELPTPPSVSPVPPTVAPRVHKHHRKHAAPKPAEGVEKL
jgi:hypothetical protein